MQTLWVREHNFWADTFAGQGLDDDGIYLRARAIVGAEIQLITYRDFLPILLGPNALTPYTGYKEAVDPRVSIAFSAAAFRLGHTYLPSVLMRLNKRGISIGDLALGQSIFAPNLITSCGNRALSARPRQTTASGSRCIHRHFDSEFHYPGI